MSTIRNFDDALDFFPKANRGGRLAERLDVVRAMFAALSESLQACHRYQELTARGVPHAAAAEMVFAEHFSAR